MRKQLLFGFAYVALFLLFGTAEAADIKASKDSNRNGYIPPTAQEMAPMRSEYLADLAKIYEPPEMTGKPLQVRKAVSPNLLKVGRIMSALGSPEKATHEQRLSVIHELLEIANSKARDDGVDRDITYSVIAVMACLDGSGPQTVIEYASNVIGDRDDAIALRARMYLKAGDREKALNDLEIIMAKGNGQALTGGGVDPLKESTPCGWSIADFDTLSDDPRALSAKGLYLSSFIGYGAADRGTVKESNIRDLYKRAARSWNSPIPHLLEVAIDSGLGSKKSMNRARCIRANDRIAEVPDLVDACAKYDEATRQGIRELTMALVVEPTHARALSMRANEYLRLAQAYYADGNPSRQLFELAITDYTAAIAVGGDKHSLYCDRALALALIGKYKDAAIGYIQGMKYAKNGIESDPFIYEQLAGLYMKLGKSNEAVDLLTQAIINSSGSGMDAVILFGGIKVFRTLYPEYGLLSDEILAEAVRRRYQPQFPESWDTDFISNGGSFKGKIVSSILPELYVLRGDAYMKAGRRAEALADFRRVKSDAWGGNDYSLPSRIYFDQHGKRNLELPEAWPPLPPTM